MNLFHICYLLSQACLGEINVNFRRIYFSIKDNTITLYFILEKYDEDDEETIEDEIVSEFSILTENFLEASGLDDNFIISKKIIISNEPEYYIKNHEEEYFEEFYRRKE